MGSYNYKIKKNEKKPKFQDDKNDYLWLEDNKMLKKEVNLQFNFENKMRLNLREVLKSIDQNLTQFFMDHLDQCDTDPNFGDEIPGLFYFTKQKLGGYF